MNVAIIITLVIFNVCLLVLTSCVVIRTIPKKTKLPQARLAVKPKEIVHNPSSPIRIPEEYEKNKIKGLYQTVRAGKKVE